MNSTCVVCGNGVVDAVIMLCWIVQGLYPLLLEEKSDLARLPGFVMEDVSMDVSRVTPNKQIFWECWSKSREG